MLLENNYMNRNNKRIRVIIDTNLYISMLIGKRIVELRPIFAHPKYELVITNALIQEIRLVTSRPKFIRYFKHEDVEEFLQYLTNNSICYQIEKIPKRCRDPKDDFLLELAVVADADYLLSGDSDLIEIKQIGNCRILTVNELLETIV